MVLGLPDGRVDGGGVDVHVDFPVLLFGDDHVHHATDGLGGVDRLDDSVLVQL